MSTLKTRSMTCMGTSGRTLLLAAERHFPALYPIVLIMARTGLRVGEVLLLQPEDFDFAHRRIFVQRAWGRKAETVEERFHQPPKGGPDWVDASDQVCAIVQRLLTSVRRRHFRRSGPVRVAVPPGLDRVHARIRASGFGRVDPANAGLRAELGSGRPPLDPPAS